MNHQDEYLVLLSKTYKEAVKCLLEKYGPARDDYFREKSYVRFMKYEIKRITRGNYKRTSEGLECHHIDENKFLNMSTESFIKDQKIPFKHHKKQRLVFANIIEHAILHVLITKETEFRYGHPGYIVFLRPKIEDWYIKKNIPQKSKWHIACYLTSFVTLKEATELLETMDEILDSERTRIKQEKLEEKKNVIQKGNYRNLTDKNTSIEIISAMYKLNKIGAFGYFREFNTANNNFHDYKERMEVYDLDGILKNIHLFIDYVEGKIEHEVYRSQVWLYKKTKAEVETERKLQEKIERERTLKNEDFYAIYPEFKGTDIQYDVKRQEVNLLLFKNENNSQNFINFQSTMKSYSKDELLEKLHSLIGEA